jgi:hypothetical protein
MIGLLSYIPDFLRIDYNIGVSWIVDFDQVADEAHF